MDARTPPAETYAEQTILLAKRAARIEPVRTARHELSKRENSCYLAASQMYLIFSSSIIPNVADILPLVYVRTETRGPNPSHAVTDVDT